MDGLALLSEATAAGLTVQIDGDRLVIRGPRSADAIARALLKHKMEVMAILRFGSWVPRPDTRSRLGWQSPDALVPWPAWEDLPEPPESVPADATARACWWCGQREWWRSKAWPDVVRCGWCSPPAPGVPVDWLNRSKACAPG